MEAAEPRLWVPFSHLPGAGAEEEEERLHLLRASSRRRAVGAEAEAARRRRCGVWGREVGEGLRRVGLGAALGEEVGQRHCASRQTEAGAGEVLGFGRRRLRRAGAVAAEGAAGALLWVEAGDEGRVRADGGRKRMHEGNGRSR